MTTENHNHLTVRTTVLLTDNDGKEQRDNDTIVIEKTVVFLTRLFNNCDLLN